MPERSRDGVPDTTTVLVIGGGPAGSITAALLAREGVDVTLLERDKHPRYHIGESLLPSLMPILHFAGLTEKIENHGFIKKPGGLFKVKHDVPPGYIEFKKASSIHYSFQVVRSEFDHLLFEHAGEEGARTYENCRVTDIHFAGERPVAASWKLRNGEAGRIAFDYLVDASGLHSLMSLRYLKNREFQETFRNVGIVQYWRNTDKLEGDKEGAIFVEALTDGAGWSWVIPLHDGTTSIGIVIHSDTYQQAQKTHGSLEEIYRVKLDLCPDTLKLIGRGKPEGEVRIFQDYSYAARKFSGPGFRLAGDAAGFIDPFFSTGIHMACLGALSAAATICSVRRGEVAEDRALAYHEKLVRRAYVRLMMAVSGVYRQIRNQQDVVMVGVSPHDFQLAFDFLQPLVSGNIDLNARELSRDTIERTMNYVGNSVVELHNLDSGSLVSRVIAKKHARMDLEDVKSVNAIDGLYIRMRKGELGLQKIGMLQSSLNAVTHNVIRKVLKAVAFVERTRGRARPA